MGTNYYVEQKPHCEDCKRLVWESRVHIGKSSVGWKFIFRGDEFRTFAEWEKFLRAHDGMIKDEYGESISAEQLITYALSKKDGMNLAEYYEKYPEHRQPFFDRTNREWEDRGCRFYNGDFG